MYAHLFFIYLHDVSDNVDPALGREQLEQGLGQGFLVVSTDFQFYIFISIYIFYFLSIYLFEYSLTNNHFFYLNIDLSDNVGKKSTSQLTTLP